MLGFQLPDCDWTLEEGLGESYASHDDLVTGRGVSDSDREFFRCLDAAHVVFGCSTTLSNEAMVNVPLVLFGCLRMHRRWPWSDFDRQLNVHLVDIRREYGIRVVTVP